MDTEAAIQQRLAMILNGNPRARVLVIGRYMPPVRVAYNAIRRAASPSLGLRQTVSGGSHLAATTRDGGRLDAYAPYDAARGLRANAVLFIGELDAHANLLLDGFAAAGAATFATLGV